jgi:ATP-dependent RNA helicase DDX46/PRP5
LQAEKSARQPQQPAPPEQANGAASEEDPLDVYMAGLKQQVTPQALHVAPANPANAKDSKKTSKVVEVPTKSTPLVPTSFGSFMTDAEDSAAEASNWSETEDGQFDTPYGGTTPGRDDETEQEREAREDKEHKEFMAAIRKKREEEDESIRRNAVSNDSEYDADDSDEDVEEAPKQRSALELLADAQKRKDLKRVDHNKIEYAPFKKRFFIVPQEIRGLGHDQVAKIRKDMEITIRGKGCPRPISTWLQCGFSSRVLAVIKRQQYQDPFPIQRQAMPAIMDGRDVIGVAKTGSGKTLAFLLPMFRHILDQPPLQEGEGPIGLVMAPARELALQIHSEAKRFCKALGLRVTAVYGGAGVAEQIADLKRGSDLVVCTPGRFIDILTMNAGKLLSLKRVTFVVLDEADRMFDMGFEPQIARIMGNTRPDRQTVLFSATFPPAVELLARQVLLKPVEIVIGGRSIASGDIKQYVEVREEKDKFLRLLQLLGKWHDKGSVLVFVRYCTQYTIPHALY